MQNKQTSYTFKELFCFYMSNHVRLASIMRNCALIIVVLTISRNFGVEAVYEDAARFNTNTTYSHIQERTHTRSTLLPRNFENRNVTSAAKVPNIQVQAVYKTERNKILLNVSWEKPLDWNRIHSYDFKVSPNSSHANCMYESFETIRKDNTLSDILLPPLLHKYEIFPGCTYKISVIINRSDLSKNSTDIIYSVPECVGKKCSCSNLTPEIKKFKSLEITPGRVNISWEVDRTGRNGRVFNITNIIFDYRPINLYNSPFKIIQSLDFHPRSNYFVLDNAHLFEINKQYLLRAIFSNAYNCKVFSYTNFTVTAVKPYRDIKRTTIVDVATTYPYIRESTNTVLSIKNSLDRNEDTEEKEAFDENRSLSHIYNSTTLDNNTSVGASAGKAVNIDVHAIYNAMRHKIVLNVTWDKPTDWEHIHSYDFKLSPNSSQEYCMHESSFETINKDKSLANILLPPLLNRYEILAGCTYKVSIITNRSYLGKSISNVIYTVPECVGKKCSCSNLTPQHSSFEATEISPGKLNISWVLNEEATNPKVYNVTEKIFAYRPSMSEPLHNNPFRNIIISSDVQQGNNYLILENTQEFIVGEPYELRAIFKNIYNCKAYLYTNFTVTALKTDENLEKDNSWVQWVLILILLSFVTLAALYLLRRNRLIIKEILCNPLSLRFSRRRSRRAEARTSYIMVPTITKRQHEINLLYVDKEIIDGNADQYEFPRSRISQIREIGKGAFGQVFLAKAFGIAQQPGYTFVAVKTLRERAPPEEIDDFLSEIEILKRVGEHPNIVKIFGCCILKEPYLMMMEYVPCGDLKRYLLELRKKWTKKRTRNDSTPVFSDTSDGAYVLPDSPMSRIPSEGRPSLTETEYTSLGSEGFPTPTEPFNNKVERSLDHTELQNFALQIARGMEHLEKIPIAHRDLAARNILINEYKTLKISDFGLSRVGPYVNNRTKKLPLRWVSLEAIEDHFFDSKGDVWSFAVVLWEIGTLGAFPYENILDGMLLHYLQSGNRLPRPEICTDELYSLMLRCWSRDPQLRPSFQELVELLDVKKRRIYVDFNQLNPLYVFPPSKVPEFDKHSNLPQSDSTA